ncbi:cache domain-containing protein, partial [Malaciobacter mytili]|uniref:cache domain-containing protein n=1 Tax=Malaciobacter mytili TaxID=603050 RepID=UPI003A889431
MVKSENIKNIINDLTETHNELSVKSTDNFPVTNEMVKDETKPHEDFFQSYMNDYGYYDIFVICAQHGHVMYSAAKESDYGANLSNGSLKDSALADAWKKAKELKRPVYVDMEPYAPSNGAPAMFLATPVYIDGEIKSVLVFQISDKSINDIMKFREGFGESEETYLVGADNLMRSDSFLDPKNHTLIASFSNPDKGSVDTEATKEALEGKSGAKIIIDYNNNPVLSVYSPVKIGEDFKWAIMAEIDEAEVLLTPNEIRNVIALASILLIILIGIALFTFVNSIVVKPLNVFQNGLLSFFKYLNKETEDTQELIVDRKDEIGLMSSIVNENINKIKKGLEEEKKLIDNASEIINTVNTGVLTDRILL